MSFPLNDSQELLRVAQRTGHSAGAHSLVMPPQWWLTASAAMHGQDMHEESVMSCGPVAVEVTNQAHCGITVLPQCDQGSVRVAGALPQGNPSVHVVMDFPAPMACICLFGAVGALSLRPCTALACARAWHNQCDDHSVP